MSKANPFAPVKVYDHERHLVRTMQGENVLLSDVTQTSPA